MIFMAEKKNAERYVGPIAYIVHSPPKQKHVLTIDEKEIAKEEIHFQKILKLLRFAKKHGLPVFWALCQDTDKDKLDDLLKKAGMDKKEIHFADSYPFGPKRAGPEIKIEPTRVIIAGNYTEWCGKNSAMNVR